MKVRKYLKEEIPKATTELENLPTIENWRCLAKITGIRLTVFNRCRISEVFNMLIEKFNLRDENKETEMEQIKKSLL